MTCGSLKCNGNLEWESEYCRQPVKYPQGRCDAGWEEHVMSTGPACLQMNVWNLDLLENAVKRCHEQGAQLAVPRNYHDNDLLADIVGYEKMELGYKYQLWIGIIRYQDL